MNGDAAGEPPADRQRPADPPRAARPNPAAFHLGPAHVIVYGNSAFVAAYGVEAIGQPAREAMVDLPRAAFELMDMVFREGRPLALRIVVRGVERRLLVIPRKEVDSAETYGVTTYLRPPMPQREPPPHP